MRGSLQIFNGDYDLINASERVVDGGGIKTITLLQSKSHTYTQQVGAQKSGSSLGRML